MKSRMHYFFPSQSFINTGKVNWACCFAGPLCCTFTLSHSHMEAAQSVAVFFIEKKLPQLGVKVSISAIAAEYCLFSFPLKKLGTFLLNAHFPWILFGIKT